MPDENDLLDFLRVHVRSVWGVELLLVLRAERDRAWSTAELVRELRASTAVVEDALGRFEAVGVALRGADGIRYASVSAALEGLCERLQALYKERPFTVINAIAAPPDKLKVLAEAFRVPAPKGRRTMSASRGPWSARPFRAWEA